MTREGGELDSLIFPPSPVAAFTPGYPAVRDDAGGFKDADGGRTSMHIHEKGRLRGR